MNPDTIDPKSVAAYAKASSNWQQTPFETLPFKPTRDPAMIQALALERLAELFATYLHFRGCTSAS